MNLSKEQYNNLVVIINLLKKSISGHVCSLEYINENSSIEEIRLAFSRDHELLLDEINDAFHIATRDFSKLLIQE